MWKSQTKIVLEYDNVPSEITKVGGVVGIPTTGDTGLLVVGDSNATPDATREADVHLDVPPIGPGTVVVSWFESLAGTRAVFERVDSLPGVRIFDFGKLAPSVPPPAVGAGQLAWQRPENDASDLYWAKTDIAMTTTTVHWNAFGPSDGAPIAYPALPAELAAIMPGAGASWTPKAFVLATLSDFTYATIVEVVDRDMAWWYGNGLYLPTGSVSLSSVGF